ncbi:FAD-dependent monooxygenase [Nonomuraea lactucae]|uniref:FAD-dependent monooxygenase n=1 Tax=Nonomuraea lactucae TaxID=2249762 RepID=UPI000DE1AE17|nr:FAD-dependent monooxygenase [Nonomuraea lactucae]
MIRTGLLVVGGGPVGLSAALLAHRFGLSCVLVERRPEVAPHPKARGVRNRAMELFRLWGVEERLLAGAPHRPHNGFVYCESLSGQEYGRSPAPPESSEHSPTGDSRVPQDHLEGVLRAELAGLRGVEARFGVELRSFAQDATGVTADLHDPASGEDTRIRADFMIAADGVASGVRGRLGVAMAGDQLGYWQSVFWNGDISRLTEHRTAIQYLTAPAAGGSAQGFVTVAPVDGKERWITFRMLPEGTARPGALTDEAARELVTTAVGAPAQEIEIVGTATYLVAAQVAERYRDGRVFLAGDAAHAFPPTGGFGLNTGVQDVHNLVWKLALVLQGAAPPALLDTYEEERRPIAASNARWSTANADRFASVWQRIRAGEALDDVLAGQRAHVGSLGRDLGFRYLSGALIPDGGQGEAIPASYAPSSTPGVRAPHVWITSEGRRCSTLDLFDTAFTLISRSRDWCADATAAATACGVPLRTCLAGTDGFAVAEDTFEAAYGLGGDGAVLVRPDGHVAWRTRRPPAQAEPGLREVFQRVLGVPG